MESYQRGDRVSLREPLGPITTAEIGLVVEVNAERRTFEYGVVFNSLGRWKGEQGPWITDKVDLSQFRIQVTEDLPSLQLNVVPFSHDELVFFDSELRGVLA